MSKVKEFKVGQVWLNRKGLNVTITKIDGHVQNFPIECYDYTYTLEGKYFLDDGVSYMDLIKLIKDVETPTTTKPNKESTTMTNSTPAQITPHMNESTVRQLMEYLQSGKRESIVASLTGKQQSHTAEGFKVALEEAIWQGFCDGLLASKGK